MICVSCQKEISPERLEVLPNTKHCTACSQEKPNRDVERLCAKSSDSNRNGFARAD